MTSTVFTSGTVIESPWLNDVNTKTYADTSNTVAYTPAGTSAVVTTVQAKLRQTVSVMDFGAVGNGVADDTAAIQAALAASDHVIVPIGTYLISSTVAVRAGCKLEFQGGNGNSAQNPTAYFIKKSTMTTWGITIDQAGIVTGGGLLGQVGNTGGGVWLLANAAVLTNFWVKTIGGYGVKVGSDSSVQRNCNATRIDSVTASNCTDHGFLIDDDFATVTPDANAGTISNCRAISNGGSGIFIGYAYWVTILNCNCENNTGHGVYLSGVNKNSYPACRWATILGGDYNEGNTAGVIYDASYFATFVNPDGNNLPTTASNGLQGSALRNYVGSFVSTFQGIQTENYANTFQTTGGLPSVNLRTIGTNTLSNGAGITFAVDPATGTYRTQGRIKGYQIDSTNDGLDFSANIASTLTRIFLASGSLNGVTPAFDNTYQLGHSSYRWTVVYAVTGTINTSDAREKQQGRTLLETEKSVALKIKSSLKAFKWNDAVDKKGDKARWHFGVYAQDIAEAFKSEGLNPDDYGMFCYDEWKEQPEIKDEDGNITSNFIPAGNRYGVRYEELFAFVLACL